MSDGDEPTCRRERIVLAIREADEPITIPELAARLESHPATVERCCLELQRDGTVRQCTGGKLVVDEPGRAPASD